MREVGGGGSRKESKGDRRQRKWGERRGEKEGKGQRTQKPGTLDTCWVKCGCAPGEEPGCPSDPSVLMDRPHDLRCPIGKPLGTHKS